MARQLGWGLAGLPYPAETWPVLGAPAVWVMGGGEVITTQPLPETGAGTQDRQECGRTARAIMGVQRAECNARFKAEEPEPLAQLAERISGGAKKSCRGPELAPSSSPRGTGKASLYLFEAGREIEAVTKNISRAWASPCHTKGPSAFGAISKGFQSGGEGPAPLPLVLASKCHPSCHTGMPA